jgi:threonine aldolase
MTPPDVRQEVVRALRALPPPDRGFGSDNESGAHPEVLAAIAEASPGHVPGYGHDRWTTRCAGEFVARFGADIEVLLVWNGTGANVVALQTLLPKYGAVICPSGAHIDVDETGAPERIVGAKIRNVATVDGKLRPEQITPFAREHGVEHHVQVLAVSITQSTELGTLYTVDEIAAICDEAHRHGMVVHLDGARIANACAALGVSPRAMTFDAGVDAVSFGGTKNGMLYGEAVVLAPQHARQGSIYLRKQTTQLASKMRFIATQFSAMFDGDLWLRSAAHANTMAKRLERALSCVDGVSIERSAQVNSIFPILPSAVIEPLQEWSHHYTWDADRHQVRFVTSFDTTDDDVTRMAEGVAAACAAAAGVGAGSGSTR